MLVFQRGMGRRAHIIRADALGKLEAMGLLRLVGFENRSATMSGPAHMEYTVEFGGREVVLRTKDVEPFVAGVLWGREHAGAGSVPWVDGLYRDVDASIEGVAASRDIAIRRKAERELARLAELETFPEI